MRAAVLTVSERAFEGTREDASGPVLVRLLGERGWQVVRSGVVPDDQGLIAETLSAWAAEDEVDLILTTGGTGFGRKDCTPEATLSVVEKLAPGLTEAMRSASLMITPHAMLSRAAAGILNNTLIVNLPGSPKAARENLDVILPALPHAVQLLRDDPDSEAAHRKHHGALNA